MMVESVSCWTEPQSQSENLLAMKRLLTLLWLSALVACQSAGDQVEPVTSSFTPKPQFVDKWDEVPILPIGAEAPPFRLPGVDGRFYALDDFASAEVLVLLFTCNHCPTAQAYEDRIMSVVDDYKSKGVQVVAISPNSPLGLLYEELGYTDLNDDYEEMVLRSEYAKFNFPYLYDGDDHGASLQYGPVATPHAYVFDQQRRLTYQGRLDAVEKPGTTNAEDLRAAIDATLAGTPVAEPTTKVFGCSTKWGWKSEARDRVDRNWAAREVSLLMADEEEIRRIVRNEGGDKLRLINVWATWCGPCIVEYPEFIVLQRMYGARDFEFVSVSADKPEHHDKALKFLQNQQSGVANYLFGLDDKYKLIEAVDPEWNGALPYTMLVDPEGKKVWSYQGEVDFLTLKRAIIDHPMMGRYF